MQFRKLEFPEARWREVAFQAFDLHEGYAFDLVYVKPQAQQNITRVSNSRDNHKALRLFFVAHA